MVGKEVGFAGALFFSLMSLGAFIKLDDIIGLGGGVLCAILAAACLRVALIKSAQTAEDDYQRLEVQFQQLRNKINEISAVNVESANSITDAAQIVQENLQVIRVRLAELDNLTQIAEKSSAANSELEKLNATADANKANVQTVLKLLQLVAQLINDSKKNAPNRRD